MDIARGCRSGGERIEGIRRRRVLVRVNDLVYLPKLNLFDLCAGLSVS